MAAVLDGRQRTVRLGEGEHRCVIVQLIGQVAIEVHGHCLEGSAMRDRRGHPQTNALRELYGTCAASLEDRFLEAAAQLFVGRERGAGTRDRVRDRDLAFGDVLAGHGVPSDLEVDVCLASIHPVVESVVGLVETFLTSLSMPDTSAEAAVADGATDLRRGSVGQIDALLREGTTTLQRYPSVERPERTHGHSIPFSVRCRGRGCENKRCEENQ